MGKTQASSTVPINVAFRDMFYASLYYERIGYPLRVISWKHDTQAVLP